MAITDRIDDALAHAPSAAAKTTFNAACDTFVVAQKVYVQSTDAEEQIDDMIVAIATKAGDDNVA
jgi:hypothetical protein